jgi:hypothetical protein
MVMKRRRPANGQRVFRFLEPPVLPADHPASLLRKLPILPADDPCRGCGACCLHLGWPPFYRTRDRHWKRLVRERPDLVAEIERARKRADIYGEHGPCIWFDRATRRCRHYDYRPEVCRDYEPGAEDCRLARARHWIDWPWR